jgi:hypothetical protein
MNNLLIDNKYLIIENLLNEQESNDIEKKMYDSFFPWYLTVEKDEKGNMYTVSPEIAKQYKDDKNVIDQGQFVHSFIYVKNNKLIENSIHKDIALNILQKFCIKTNLKNVFLLRSKANLITESKKYTKNSYGIPHIDFDINHYVLIYYVNDSDGDTVLFDENKKIYKKISPKKNSVLLFRGNILHAGGHPVESSTRCVINFNLQIKDN